MNRIFFPSHDKLESAPDQLDILPAWGLTLSENDTPFFQSCHAQGPKGKRMSLCKDCWKRSSPHPSRCVTVSVQGTRVREKNKELFLRPEMAAGMKKYPRDMIDAGCLRATEPPSAFPSF